ncbi:hypothetical protein BDQ17DRAFT_1247855 [Cyathus striatus]|nr:hypothetical protein BDQ17DRAFT_1247855 [Cyathus striatus]
MYTNPYAQGGWTTSSTSSSCSGWTQAPSSVLGALPIVTGASKKSGFQTFHFTSFNPNILKCVVIGPTKDYIDVITTSEAPECTVLRRADGEAIAIVEWFRRPFVEICGILPRTTAGQLLVLSPDRSSITMKFRGKTYIWVSAQANNSICLYNMTYNPSEIVARVLIDSGSVTLQKTNEAIHSGLTEVTIVTTIILFSGRNFE